MGTSGAYTGAGGKAGKAVGEGLSDWIDSLPGSPDDGDSTPNLDGTGAGEKPVTPLPPKVVSGLMGLLRPRSPSGGSSDGPGAGGGGIATGVARLPAGAVVLVRARADRRSVLHPSAVGLLRAPTRTCVGMRLGCTRWVSTTANSVR